MFQRVIDRLRGRTVNSSSKLVGEEASQARSTEPSHDVPVAPSASSSEPRIFARLQVQGQPITSTTPVLVSTPQGAVQQVQISAIPETGAHSPVRAPSEPIVSNGSPNTGTRAGTPHQEPSTASPVQPARAPASAKSITPHGLCGTAPVPQVPTPGSIVPLPSVSTAPNTAARRTVAATFKLRPASVAPLPSTRNEPPSARVAAAQFQPSTTRSASPINTYSIPDGPAPYTASLRVNTEFTTADRARVKIGQTGVAHNWPMRFRTIDRIRSKLEIDFENWHIHTAKEVMDREELLRNTGVNGHLRRAKKMVYCRPGQLIIPAKILNALKDIIYIRWATAEWHSNLPVPSVGLHATKTAGHRHYVNVLISELALFEESERKLRVWRRQTGCTG